MSKHKRRFRRPGAPTINPISVRQALVVAEQNSFERAASVLGTHRSGVSRRVRSLEEQLGVALFERHPRGVKPTPIGTRFLKQASEALAQLDDALGSATAAATGATGQLRIGILSSVARGYLRELIKLFKVQNADVVFQIIEGDPLEQIGLVRKGLLDVVFMVDAADVPGCYVEPLWTERFFVALPEKHVLAKKKDVAWEALRNEQFILRRCERGPALCERVFRRLSEGGHEPSVRKLEVGRELLMHLVAVGSEISLTSESTTATHFPGVIFRPIAGSDATVQFSAVWSRSNVNPAFHRFLTLARSQSRNGSGGSLSGWVSPAAGPIISVAGLVGGLARKLGLWT